MNRNGSFHCNRDEDWKGEPGSFRLKFPGFVCPTISYVATLYTVLSRGSSDSRACPRASGN